MTKLKLEANLVGMRHRPPADDVVKLLPAGTELLAQRQPENPYDSNAVQVLLMGFCVGGQHEALYQQFADEAKDDSIRMDRLVDPLPLGYICNAEKTGGLHATTVSEALDAAGTPSIPVKLAFSMQGLPMVAIDAELDGEVEVETEEEEEESEDDEDTDTQDTSVNTDVR